MATSSARPGETGSGAVGVNLAPHLTGNPMDQTGVNPQVTVGHTWLIIVIALGLLWLLGAGVFRSVRM